jgi:hypothetical protein
VPLFPPNTVARDIPPIYLQMLQHPELRTVDQARAHVQWMQHRMQAARQVEALIQQVTNEAKEPPHGR